MIYFTISCVVLTCFVVLILFVFFTLDFVKEKYYVFIVLLLCVCLLSYIALFFKAL